MSAGTPAAPNAWRHWVAWLALIGIGALGLWLAHHFSGAATSGPLQRLDRAHFSTQDAPSPPAAEDPIWQIVALPDDWSRTRPGESGLAWYRLDLPALANTHSAGIVLPRVGNTYSIWLNGVEVADGGGMEGTIRRLGLAPQWVVLPRPLLRDTGNVLHIKLRVGASLRGGLAAPWAGSRDATQDLYESLQFWRVNLVRAIAAGLVLVAVIAGVLWWRNRPMPVMAAFAAYTLIWAARNAHLTSSGEDWDIPQPLLDGLNMGGMLLLTALQCMILARLQARNLVWLEKWLVPFAAVCPLALWLLDAEFKQSFRGVWALGCLSLGLSFIAWFVWRVLRDASEWQRLGAVTASLLVLIACGIHDTLIATGRLAFGDMLWMPYAPVALTLGLIWVYAKDAFDSLARREQHRLELERAVQQRTLELEQSHQRVLELSSEAAKAQERERLMRDIHDGIGSLLMVALRSSERGQLQPRQAHDTLQQSLDELRALVDSLDPTQASLTDALSTLRHRWEPRLRDAGIASDWQLEPLGGGWPASAVLDAVRIVQEALTNVVKHAQASHVGVRLSAQSASHTAGFTWQLTVQDNGKGLAQPQAPAGASIGRGLQNMRARARTWSFELSCSSAPPGQTGTCITLSGATPPDAPPTR